MLLLQCIPFANWSNKVSEILLKDLDRCGCCNHQHSKFSVADWRAHLGAHSQEVRAVPGAESVSMREYHESRQRRQR